MISGNTGSGIKIEGEDAVQNYVGANLIGTTHTGLDERGNFDHGIYILNAPHTRIGAALANEPPLSGNTVSDNVDGIRIEGSLATSTIVGGNFIGTNFEGQPSDSPLLRNLLHGMHIRDSANNFIGGFVSAGNGGGTQLPGNTIAGNGSVGVRIIGDTATGNRVQRNSIFVNGGLGIDLEGDGVTSNDHLDEDSSPNKLQNFPLLTLLENGGLLRGTLNSTPDTKLEIDLYLSEKPDPSGKGEGQFWEDHVFVTTDESGDASFEFTVDLDEDSPPVLTMTATDPDGNTSEFSDPLELADLAVDRFTWNFSYHRDHVLPRAPAFSCSCV